MKLYQSHLKLIWIFEIVYLTYVANMAPVETQSVGEINQLNLVKHTPMKINMAMLIDFMLQKTYHDLIVMAEL